MKVNDDCHISEAKLQKATANSAHYTDDLRIGIKISGYLVQEMGTVQETGIWSSLPGFKDLQLFNNSGSGTALHTCTKLTKKHYRLVNCKNKYMLNPL